jgi:hypothetical protein
LFTVVFPGMIVQRLSWFGISVPPSGARRRQVLRRGRRPRSVTSGFDRADLVVAVGHDPIGIGLVAVESGWNHRILHMDTQPNEVAAAYNGT